MGDVAVENPFNMVSPHKKQTPSHVPNIDIEGIGNDDSDEYSTLKKLQRHLEYTLTPMMTVAILKFQKGTSIFKKSTSRMSRGKPTALDSQKLITKRIAGV